MEDTFSRYLADRQVLLRGAGGDQEVTLVRQAAMTLSDTASRLIADIETLSILNPSDQEAIPRLVDFGEEIALDVDQMIEAIKRGDESSGDMPQLPKLDIRVDIERDVLVEIFGVPATELEDDRGEFMDTWLIARYRKRLDVLQQVCDNILLPLTGLSIDVFTAVRLIRDIVTSDSPFSTLSTADRVRSLIGGACRDDLGRTARILEDLRSEQPKQAFSRERLTDRRVRFHAADTERDRAVNLLEAYKYLSEAFIRRWAWALVRLTGDRGSGQPTLGQLQPKLAKKLGELGSELDLSLLVAARNAEAHDEFEFDEIDGVLVIGSARLDTGELASAFSQLDSIHRGWELGHVVAVLESPELLAAATGRKERSHSTDFELARSRFGHAGLKTTDFRRDREVVEIELEKLVPQKSNPCFMALTQSNGILRGVSRYLVKVEGRDDPVIDLPTHVLDANLPVFGVATATFPDGLPQSTFLPAQTWTRLEVESTGEALKAAAFFVLNDAQHAILDIEEGVSTVEGFFAHLELIVLAGEVTAHLLPNDSGKEYLTSALRRVKTAAKISRRNGLLAAATNVVLDGISVRRDELGVRPAVMPTLDTDPMTELADRNSTS